MKKSYLCKELVRRLAGFSLVAGSCLAAALTAPAANLVQEFYLPMPEQQIYTANSAIISGTGSTIASTFSIVVTGNGTVIYYDQWEDGYETDLGNPTQPTTQIWGDGNDAHGIPPGFAHNPLGLPAGTVITLTNNVALPRNPSTILYDARDRIAANKALIISRAGWPIPTGPVFAGAASVLSTIDYGTNYISPVGQNLAPNLFKYVGMFIMAAQNNTAVTIDPNGNGVGTTNIVLNQGESYLVNGGIKTGGRVSATKPVQADLIIGHVGSAYASDWFTLYPASAWSSSYYTPVGSAAKVSQPAYVYLYNPGNAAITINYNTQVGSGSFSVPGTNGVYQFQMPVGSGASFVSAGGQSFYALCTVAANNSSDTAYNWGFTLVPQGALTTEASVGWGPGSADGTVDGSPVWVTALAGTKLYVDYKGDHAGPLTDPNGNNYDTNFTVTALQSQKILDPGKNQTGMRVYTVDGTLITAAWGEDPDTAQPGNPYIDAGTTVLPFPVPVVKKSAVIVTDTPPAGLSIGDTIRYTVEVDNKGLLPLGNTVVIDAPSGNLSYVANSTTFDSNSIPDNASGQPFPLAGPGGYTIPVILSQGVSTFQYLAKINAGGVVSNSVNIGGTTISAQAYLAPPPTNGASVALNFTDTGGTTVAAYSVGGNVFVTMTNAVANTASNSVQTISVTVVDTNDLDLETITLTETGNNTGVFRNTVGLPASATSGLGQQDGILNVAPGDTLSVSYTDPNFGDSASATATISFPTPNKQLYLSVNGSTNGVQDLNRVNPAATANHGTTYSSMDIGSAGSGSTGIVGLSNNGYTGLANAVSRSKMTNTFTVAAANNQLMLVGIASRTTQASSVTFSNFNLGHIGYLSAGSGSGAVDLWALTNPPAITANVIVSFSAATTIGACFGVTTFTNVNTNAPLGAIATASGSSGNPAVTVVSTNNGMVYDIVSIDSQTPAATPATGQTSLFYYSSASSGSGWTSGGASVTNGANGNVKMSWSSGSHTWAAAGISINPAPATAGGSGPATNVTSFAQTPAFASSFTLPAGGIVTITNFITLTNGSLTATPAITATLRANGTNFITLSNPVYASASNTLVWSGVLPASVTIPAGTNITYVISNGVSGTAFHVNYDSTNAPSVIVLPASSTTVIAFNSFGIYDAPYPGGSLVSSPVAGSTLYLRANVSDPFGSYDITSLGLAVSGPDAGSSFTNTLTDANVVTNDDSSKTYEFQWATGPTTGGYNIAVTAHEGTEGVTATAVASLTTTFLDLGTPSTTDFTSGNNGSATNGYPVNSSVCVRVADLNRNTNAATAESVIATVSSSSGDSEIITLTETGTNTGVFTACLVTTNSTGGAPNDGILLAPVGSILTVNYSDPTDPGDNTSATAAITPAPGIPGVSMSKTLVSPADGQVGVSQPVTYNLQVVNTGSTTLTNVIVTDNFPSAKLSYASASPAPSSTGSGVLTWNNLGGFAPGQSTNISVTFTTLATGAATNSATANGGTATNTSSVTLQVNRAALNVTKILLSPTNQPVAVGSNVVFRITFQNVGNTVINYLPFEDNFSGAYYTYVSATIPANGSGYGSLIWTNIAVAGLATNAIITNDVTMMVAGQGSPANNTAIVDYATDIYGNPVPTASSTIGVTTASASVNGYVYTDATTNHSGLYSTNDTGLSGVTLKLYTADTNGNPDTLVQQTVSGGNGYYELLNLNVGQYVLVGTLLTGNSGSAPPNNQYSLNLTNLAAVTNINFFQYVTPPALDSTFSGTVFSDTNGFGTNTSQAGLANVTIALVQDVNSNGVADAGEPVVNSAQTDGNGNYSFAGIAPGHYVLAEGVPFGYYASGDSQPPNDAQIYFVTTNAVVSTTNNFFLRLSPTAVNDTNAAYYFVATGISPLTNDLSPNGDALTISNAVSTNGIVVINPGSTNLTFTPTSLGATTITYTIVDAHGGTSTATITVNVTALADLAIAKSAAAAVFAASNLTYTISVTNFGPSPASSIVITDALPAGVSFVNASGGGANNSGVVTWNLGDLAVGTASNVTVTVTAPAGGPLTNTASVSSPTPDPVATNNVTPPVITTVTPVADLGLGKSAADTVLAANDLTYTISVTNFGPSTASSVVVTDALPAGVTFVSASGNGVNNAGVASWNLGDLANGAVSNVTVTVTVSADGSLTNTASVSSPTGDPNPTNNVTPPVVTSVTPVADVAVSKSGPVGIIFGTNFDYTITVTNFGPSTATGIIVTDSLPAGLVFVSSSPATTTNASNQVIWSALGDLAAGTGTNLTVTVISTVRGSVTNVAAGGSPVLDPVPTNNATPPVVTAVTNNPPLASPDSYAMTENTTNTLIPLVNDTVQTPGGSLAIIAVNATNGTATIAGTNVVFTPALNFLGTATIGYTITDNVGGTNSSLITITVTNVPPLANPDSYAIAENSGTNTFSPLVNDVVQTPGGSLALIGVSPTNGTAVVSGTNVLFAPATNFLGVATIGYSITDGIGGTTFGLITVSVTNRPPVAVNDTASTPKNVVVTIPALANDFDPDGNPLSLVSVSPTNGTANISGTNVVFTPATNFLGTAFVGYSITDGNGGTNSALITISVTNRLPVAVNDSASAPENVAVTVPVLVNDADPDGDALAIVSVSPTNGTAVISGTNVVFTPATNFLGIATVGYVITDGFGGTNSALLTISVTNIPPVANPDSYSVTENTTNTLSPLVNDLVVTPGGSLSLIAVSPTNGTAGISGTNVIFTPALNFVGTATIGYTITDSIGGTNSSLITVTVTNIPPVANPDSYSVSENSTNTFSPLVNDTVQTPGGSLSLVSVNPTNGIASISGTNIIFTPTNDFTGTATIGYTITDGIGGTNSSVITVNVTDLADIAVSKSAPASVLAATNFDYTITVTNLGPGLAASVSVTDSLPAAVSFVSASSGGVTNGGIVTWSLGSLAAGTATNLTLTVTAPVSGVTLTNLASGGSPTSDPNPTNNTSLPVFTSVTPIANLAIGKTGPADVAATGNLTYAISVTNFGPSTASSVVVTDALPAGVTFVSATGGGANDAGVVVWNLGDLAFGLVSNVTVTVTAPADGTLTNVANVASPTLDTNLTDNVTPPVVTAVTPVADVGLGKSAAATVLATSNLVYTISVTNYGPSIASSVVVTDALPAGVTFVSASGDGTNNDGVVTWNLGDLADGAVSNVTVTIVAPVDGSLTNVAGVNSPSGDPNLTNNVTPPVVTGVTPLADLAVGKSGPAGITFNTGFSYTISVTNFGPSDATGIVVTDSLPAGLVFVGATPSAETNAAGQVVWTGLGDLSAGTTTNLTLTVLSTVRGAVTNLASGGSPTQDSSLTNNTSLPVVTLVTNIPPVANPDGYAMTENTTNTFSPLLNDVVQTPGGSLTIIGVSSTNGTASISGTNVVFTPALNFLGTATIGYTIADNVGGTNSGLITITVTNIPPVANPDADEMAENTQRVLFPLVNDLVKTPGGSLVIVAVSPTNGSAVDYGTNIVFTPATNFVGTATIGYTIGDGIGGTNRSLITVTVTNIPPVANPDSYAVTENTTNTFSPLANDLMLTPGGSLTIIGVSPTNGTASINGTNVIFTPATSFIGTATIGYTITDGIGGTNSSLITVTVTNIPPLANPDSYAVTENTTNTFSPLLNDALLTPGGSLTIIGVSPTNGTASISGPNIVFVPAANFLGAATIGYTVTDGIGGTNSSLITVTVTNIPPLANPDSYAVTENTTNTFSPLLNDALLTPGGSLTIIGVSPTNGTASISGPNIVFVPAANFLGAATIGYTVTDGIGGTNSSLITVTVTNIPPLANPDSYAVTENTTNTFSPLLNDALLTPGGSLTIIGVSPTNGTASISGTNVIFTPALNFVGTATIGYTITDGIGGTNRSLITVTVTNIPPAANPDNYAVTENTTNTFSPLANDLMLTPGGSLTIIGVSPTNGTASISGTNVIFTPTLNFIGTATIGYIITDGIGGTNSSLITVTVTNVPPVANPDGYAMTENTTNTFSPLVNDLVLTPGGGLTIIGVNPTNGVASISGTNVIFTPALNFVGTATIGYTITDGIGGTNSSLITVTVTNVPPLANPDNYTIAENSGTNVFSPLVNDAVLTPGGALSLIAVNPTNGMASISGTNLLFAPATNFFGVATIGYTVSDGIGGTNTGLVTVTVTNVPPAANGQSVNTTQNTPMAITLAGTDPNHLPLTFTIATSPANGALSLLDTNTGAVTYTPNTDYIGGDSFTFTVNNGQTSSVPATVSISVAANNGADVRVTLFGPALVTVGDEFSFTTLVTNAGPWTATNTLVTNALPANLVFAGVTGGGAFTNGLVTWPVIAALADGQATNLMVTVKTTASGSTISPTANPFNYILTNNPPAVSAATNRASAFAATFDPDLTNNIASASYTNAQAQTLIVPGVFSVVLKTNTYPTNAITTNTVIPIGTGLFIAGTSAFNPQTQLYEEFVAVTNIGQAPVHALRLSIGGLRSGVTLYNATGTNSGVPYVEYDPPYDSPLNPYPAANSSVTFTLEFFVADRHPFTNSLTVTAIVAPVTPPPNSTNVTAIIQYGFNDVRNPATPRFLVEFTSIPGRTYTVEYKDGLDSPWLVAAPSIVASATSTFWYDDGPPVTVTPPSYPNAGRYYRVLLNP